MGAGRGSRPAMKAFLVLGVLLLVAILSVGLGVGSFDADSAAEPFEELVGLPRRPFDPAAWNRRATPADLELRRIRDSMVDDLLASKVLLGRSEGDVQALLGTPDMRDDVPVGDAKALWRWRLGPGFMNDRWLAVAFDAAGTAVSASWQVF